VPWALERNDDWNNRQSLRFAGDAAEREASSRRRFDGHQDQQCAANMLAFISTSGEAARHQN
jgi:hypothetical protein